jgi:hypothetical protein
VAQRVIHDDRYPEKSAKPLKSKERKKRRIHRQNSSKLVKTGNRGKNPGIGLTRGIPKGRFL